MPKSTDCWGIEVGSNAIKALRLRRAADEISVAEFEVIPFKKILTTPDLNVEEAIRVGLDTFTSRHDVKNSTVVVGIPGHMAFARFAKLPPVEPKRIPDIVSFEAVQQIPFPIDQVEWDYQTFQDPESPDVEVGIFAITKERLAPWLQNFQSVNMPVHGMVLTPVAVFNAMSHDYDLAESGEGCILMDIGTVSTDLIITENGRAWLRTIPIGGNHFTDALVRSFKLSFSKAEKLKRDAASSKYARQIFQAMRPVFVDLVQEVQKSLGYYQSLNREANLTKLYGLGSTWRLPGLQTFLKQQLQLDVTRVDSFKKIEVEGRDAATFAENSLSFAPAYGMAMQGLSQAKVNCNLLPRAVGKRQLWKAKTPWFIGAAAVTVIAAGLALASVILERASYNSPENRAAREQVDKILVRAKTASSKLKEVRTANDPRTRIANINAMLDYRTLWPTIMRDIDQAILALDPQAALISGDTNAIMEIPRRERRIFYVEEISVAYDYKASAERFTGTATERRVAPIQTPEGQEPGPDSWEQRPPAYVVRLIGTTPFDTAQINAGTFVESGLISYLKQHADKHGRPYRIDADSVVIASRSTVSEDKTKDGSKSGRTGSPLDRGTDEFSGPIGVEDDGPVTEDVKQITLESIYRQLLPKPALHEESRAGDRRFEIVWRVELLPPASETLPAPQQPGRGSADPAPQAKQSDDTEDQA